jgi:hypothetical protein
VADSGSQVDVKGSESRVLGWRVVISDAYAA